jgi:tRNA (L-threonylcarbamoyladenosine(37)-C2) methyltransferase TrmO-like protein
MYSLHPIGHIRSTLRALDEAPRQGSEGAPDAWLEVNPTFARGLFGIATGDEVIVVTWLHRADRDVLEVHPRGDLEIPLAGVFTTRSPHRPNPLGATSRDRARDLRNPVADRSDRGHRWHAGRRRQASSRRLLRCKAQTIRMNERNFKNPEIASSDPFAELAKMNESSESVPVPWTISRCLSGISSNR